MHTTDPQDELFDVLLPDGTPSGHTKPRGDIHRDGDWHRSLHIWFFRMCGGRIQVLFQRRSLTKDTWPGALDVTVGGHFRAGETLEETVREAAEEVGVAVRPQELTRIGQRFAVSRDDRWLDREVAEVYATRIHPDLTKLRLHAEEVDSIVALDIANALQVFDGPNRRVTGHEARRGSDGRPTDPVEVGLERADFVEMNDDYALEALHRIVLLERGAPFEPFLIKVPLEG